MGRAEVQSVRGAGQSGQWYYREGAFLVTPDLSHSAPAWPSASKPFGPGRLMQCLERLCGFLLQKASWGWIGLETRSSEGCPELPRRAAAGRRGRWRCLGPAVDIVSPVVRRLLPAMGLPRRAAPWVGGCWEGGPTEASASFSSCCCSVLAPHTGTTLFSVLGAF